MSFSAERDAMLSWAYSAGITRLVMASYLSERGRTIDMTDAATLAEPETYVPRFSKARA